MDKNPKTSNNLRDFAHNGFASSFDYNMAQIVQGFINDSITLYTKMLGDDRGNVVNDSNFEALTKFSSRSFTEMQREYGIKAGSIIIPLNLSTNNISMGVDPVVPGFDRINHIYKMDDNVKYPKKSTNLFTNLLTLYSRYETMEDPIEVGRLLKFHTLNIELDDQLIPISYCVPMKNETITGERVKSLNSNNLYKSEIINLYTNLDKDDLYRLLTNIVWRGFSVDKRSIDVTNFRSVFRSILESLIGMLSSNQVTNIIFSNLDMFPKMEENIFSSCIMSLNRYYTSISTRGMRGYLVKKMRTFIKDSPMSDTGYSDSVSSKYSEYRNHMGVISGSRGIDFIFNHVITELLTKDLFNRPDDQDGAIFEFILSNSISFVITLASFSIGGSKFYDGIENIIDIDDIKIKHSGFTNNFDYLDSLQKDYETVLTDISEAIHGFIYGTFMMKYVYDFKGRIKSNQSISVKEYDFIRGVLRSGLSTVEGGVEYFRQMVQLTNTANSNRLGHDVRHNHCSSVASLDERDDEGTNISDITNPNGAYDSLNNVRCRLLNLGTIYRLKRYSNKFVHELWNIKDKLQEKHPLHGGAKTSYESEESPKDKFVFEGMFSKTTPNLIDSFIGGARVGGDIKSYCNHLIADAKFSAESGDEDGVIEAFRGTLVLGDLKGRETTSPEDADVLTETITAVSDIVESFGKED